MSLTLIRGRVTEVTEEIAQEFQFLRSELQRVNSELTTMTFAKRQPKNWRKTMKNLETFLAKSLHYAQEHCGDPQAWSMNHEDRANRFECVSYQVACFLAQNTVNGGQGF